MPEPAIVRVPHETVNDETVTLQRRAVAEGRAVKAGEVLAVLETSKASIEVEAPRDGYVFWCAEEGADIPVGGALCGIADTERRPEFAAEALKPAHAQADSDAPRAGGPARFSAEARRLIAEHGLDERRFDGQGLVRGADVLKACRPAQADHAPAAACEPPPAFAKPGAPARRERLPRAKRAENRMLRAAAARTVPSTVSVQVPTRGLRASIHEQSERYGSFTAVAIHELARLLREVPVLNAYQHDDAIHFYESVNVAVAMDAGKGLKAPVIRDADRKSLREIAAELQAFLMTYLRGELAAADLEGATFTLSDLSGEGVQQFVPVLNEAQAATLGIGAELPHGAGRALTLTLTFDHLLTEGRTAAGFLRALGKALAKYDRDPGAEPPAPRAPAFAPADPGDPLVGYVVRAWSGVLKAGAVEPDANFFDLGGDSIMAAQFINDLQELAEETFHAVALFDAPTAGQFAAMLRKDYPRTTAALLKRLGAGDAWAGTRAQADEPPVDEAMLAALRALIPALPKQPPRPPARKNPRAVFVLSPPRCGSTLLRVMLAGHPGLFAPPELELLNFDSLGARREYCAGPLAGKLEGLLRALMDLKGVDAEAARALMTPYEDRDLDTGSFFGELQGWLGGRLLVDKTPAYALDLHALERAEACFEAPRYVHLNRHPYGMTLSFEESRIDQVFFRVAHPFGVRRLAELIWNVCTENIRTFLANVPAARQMLLRYEDLVADPRARMLELSDFMQVPFDERMLTPYEGKEAKMTDGLHAVSRMIGDPKFHKHKSIDARMADRWREAYDRDFLGEVTWRNARALGYAREAPSGKPAAEPAGAEAQPPLSTSVVPIKRSGTKRAFFCVHPAGGSVYSFGTLVKHFDPERPIYGLQAKGVEDLEDAELHSSIEEMAAYYAEVVRSVQPEGPYLIGGRCMGGIIAFEMARRLADLGFAVPYVALLDTRNLLSSRKKHAQDPIPVKLKRFIRHFDLARKVRKWKKRRAEREALKEASPTQRRIQDLKSIHKKARRTYEAEPYAGAVTLYHNSSDTREKTYIAHWQAVAPNLECVEIRGSHVSMFQEPHIRDLAAEMARGMDRVDAQALAGRRS